MEIIFLSIITILLVFAIYRIIRDAPLKSELERLRAVEQDYRTSALQCETMSKEVEQLRIDKVVLESDLQSRHHIAEEKIAFLQSSEERLKTEFENLSRRILDERGKSLGEESRERLNNLLLPLRDQLDAFRRRVDEVHRNDTEHSARLMEQVRQLQEMSVRVSDEANMLARAIKGDAKKQGDWGEMIIERIFEASGLEKGREYLSQESFRGDDGGLKRPDFLVMLPGSKAVIVDSKVSLTAYERYCSLDDDARRQQALKEHIQSVKRHIAALQEKDYSDIGGNRTLDFIIMCIPIEPAWQVVMQADPELLYDLSDKNVVLCGPATLMITLRIIAQIWRRENENRNAELIAERAGKIYDQVCLVCEALGDARKKLSGVNEAFDLAMKRLKDGKGNLVGRVEEIRKLGAKVSRQIPMEHSSDIGSFQAEGDET
ncbi:MAG: DNA recombination protein RmuC [Chlorobiaceae bacterium]|nr:DNA recombination protein RmuC [Chlorobiaceae bacterium]